MTDAIFIVDFSLKEFKNFMFPCIYQHILFRLLSSTCSNGVLSVVCSIGFGGLLFLIVILSGLEDASATYCDEL